MKTPKTLRLQFKDSRNQLEPATYKVLAETANGYLVARDWKHRDGSVTRNEYTLTRTADGYRNQNGCEYVVVKLDTRKKPYSVHAREEGRGPASVRKFATLEEMREYVRGQWQGWDYADARDGFHSDYCTFELFGATLEELMGPREIY